MIGVRGDAAGQQAPSAHDMLEAAQRGDAVALKRLIRPPVLRSIRVTAARRTPLLLAVEYKSPAGSCGAPRCRRQHQCSGRQQNLPWLQAGALGRTEMLAPHDPQGPDLSLRNRFGGNTLIPACRARSRRHREASADHGHRCRSPSTTSAGPACSRSSSSGIASSRHVEVEKLVLAAGANPNISDKRRDSAARHAPQQRPTRSGAADRSGRSAISTVPHRNKFLTPRPCRAGASRVGGDTTA